MYNIDPKFSFWFGLVVFVAGVVAAAGTGFFSGALPEWLIPPLVKWCLIVSVLGNGIMTYVAGQNMTNAGRIANVQQVPLAQKLDSLVANNPEVKGVVTTQAVANATSSEKVISG